MDDQHKDAHNNYFPGGRRRHTDRGRPTVMLILLFGVGILITTTLLRADESARLAQPSLEQNKPSSSAFMLAANTAGDADAHQGNTAPEVKVADSQPADKGAGTDADEVHPGQTAAQAMGMIPREALVDMTRAQSGVICTSEIFLGCMGFDGTTCLSLSEAAIEQCLMTLPAEIDPLALDNESLEACPRAIYDEAGYDEAEANACFAEALEGS